MRLYRALLQLYPAGFRAEYGPELERAYAERTARSRGPLAPLRNALHALADVVPNALGVHAEILGQDVRFAVRALRRTPGYALTAVLVVALGVGANTAIFSLADLVFIRPLPFRAPEQLVKIWQASPDYGRNECSPANLRDWASMTSSFTGMAASTIRSANLSGRGEPRELVSAKVTPNLFQVLGVAPALGRVFDAAEAEAGQSLLLSDALWRTQFGADPRVLGATVRLNGEPYVVVGVMPPSFRYPHAEIEAWMPLVFHEENYRERDDTYLEVVARMKRGTTLARARKDLEVVSARLEKQFPVENRDMRALPFAMRDEMTHRSRMLLLTLCGAALCILVLACANLASLVLARALHRAHELAVRAALGAGRERLARQLVTESLGLAVVGGAAGVLAAAVGLPLLVRLVPDVLPLAIHPALDLRVLAFATLLVLLTGLAFGLAPALRASRTSPLGALATGARSTQSGTQRVRASLIVVEVAASVVLLVSSGLLIRAIGRLQAVDPGFAPSHALAVRTALPQNRYLLTSDRMRYYDRVLEQVRALPGVRSAAYATGLPMSMRGGIWSATVPGEDPSAHPGGDPVSMRYVTADYFRTLGIPLKEGRAFTERDTATSPPVIIVSASFVRKMFPGQNPLGQRIRSWRDENLYREVVGVVEEVKYTGLSDRELPLIYVPHTQNSWGAMLVVARIRHGDPASLGPILRKTIGELDPALAVAEIRTLRESADRSIASQRYAMFLLTVLAATALVLAALGIYGVTSYVFALRRRELGIRLALGATRANLYGLVFRHGLGLTAAGLAIGAAGSVAAARFMKDLLFNTAPGDVGSWAAMAGTLGAAALVACLLPARRAATAEPTGALRAE